MNNNNLNGIYKVKLNENKDGGYDVDVDDDVQSKSSKSSINIWSLVNTILIITLGVFVLWSFNTAQNTEVLEQDIAANKEKSLNNNVKIDENDIKYDKLENDIKSLVEQDEKIHNKIKISSEVSVEVEPKKQDRNSNEYYNIKKSIIPEMPIVDQKIPETPIMDQKIPEIPTVNQDLP